MEFIKRAEKYDINYVLVEPYPKFGKNYESICIGAHSYEDTAFIILTVFIATIKGIQRSLKGDIDLILSPIERLHCIVPAFITSLLTGIPFTILIHNAPVFHSLMEKYPNKEFKLTLGNIYQAIYYRKRKRKSISYIAVTAFLNYVILKILRTTTIIGIGSGAIYIQSLDKDLKVREVFPANSIPSNLTSKDNVFSLRKKYDAIYVGRFSEEKGVFDAINAWHLVKLKFPSLTLHFVGRAEDEMVLKRLNYEIDQLGLQNNVSLCEEPLVGDSSEVLLKKLKLSKILLFPSKLEAWAFVVGEALSFGLPVIGYDIVAYEKAYPGCTALIKVPIGNVNKIASEIIRIFENPNVFKKLSNEAFQYVKNYYSWEDVMAAEVKLYQEIIS